MKQCRFTLNIGLMEIHKQFGPLFNPKITQEWKENQLDLLSQRFGYLTERLKGKPYTGTEQIRVHAEFGMNSNLGSTRHSSLIWVIVHSEDRARVRHRPGIQVMQKVK
jgi:hypothetical protein